MQALRDPQKAHRRRRRNTVVVFREHKLYVEKHGFKETAESLRLMMLRDQIGELVGMMGEQREAVGIVCRLLKDEHVGVSAIAADVLKEAVIAGVDVSGAKNALEEALDDRYAKRNAAGALALLYLKRGDIAALERLLKHSDLEVRKAAGDACADGAGGCLKE